MPDPVGIGCVNAAQPQGCSFEIEFLVDGESCFLQEIRNLLKNLTYGAVCLALCMVLPFLTGQIPEIGGMLCPMHIPVLLAGFLCGPWWALLVGGIAPALRFVLFGMPPLFPTGAAMCLELAAYGMVTGLLYRRSSKGHAGLYGALIGAMVVGRIVWGVAMAVLSGIGGSGFTWGAFLSGALLNAIPGIVLQLLLVPAVVLALHRAEIIE